MPNAVHTPKPARTSPVMTSDTPTADTAEPLTETPPPDDASADVHPPQTEVPVKGKLVAGGRPGGGANEEAAQAVTADPVAKGDADERPWLGSRPAGIASPERRSVPALPSTQSLGPNGKHRTPWAVAVLSALTLGIYAIWWHRRVNNEMRNFDPRMHVAPGWSTIAVAVPWIIGLLISVAGAARILLDQFNVALPFDPHFTVLQAYYLLAGIVLVPYLELILTFSAVALVMTAERLRTCEECTEQTAHEHVRPVQLVLWLLVPITGGLVFQSVVQRRLNNVWRLAQPSLASRISQY